MTKNLQDNTTTRQISITALLALVTMTGPAQEARTDTVVP